jgi:choline dehydrogenase
MKFLFLTSIFLGSLLLNGVGAQSNNNNQGNNNNNEDNNNNQDNNNSNGDKNNNFDFIVIGSGSGGSTVAGKLSSNPKYRVLLLERGGDIDDSQEAQALQFPNRQTARTLNPYLDHIYSNESLTDIPAGSCNAYYYFPANALGGATTLHTSVYSLPIRQDVEKWNVPEWTYERVQSYISRFENYNNLNDTSEETFVVGAGWRGDNGLFVTQQYPGGTFTQSIYDSVTKTYGIPFNPDQNVESGYGVGQAQRSASGPVTNAQRSTSYDAFVKPYLNSRPNLVVLPFSTVTRIVLQKKKGKVSATGVEYVHFGKSATATVSKEVIVSASILRSPQLLLLSGIGDAEYLESKNIPVQVDLPQVGKNLQDHIGVGMAFVLPSTSFKTDGVIVQTRYSTGVDPLDTSPVNAGMHITPLELVKGGPGGVKFTVSHMLLYPACNGTVELLHQDPLKDPLVRTNCWNNRDSTGLSMDVKHLNYAFKKARSLMADLSTRLGTPIIEASPGYTLVPNGASDAVINSWILSTGVIGFQSAGTCRMGTSPQNSVVDHDLKVWGTQNLRVADISVMPVPQQGPPTGGAMVFGEAVVELLRQRWN